MQKNEVRPWTLRGQDPIAVLVAGAVLFMTTVGLHTTLGISGEQLAEYEAGALIFGGLVRYVLERRNDRRVSQEVQAMESKANREARAKPAPVVRQGAPGEGGPVETDSDDDDTPPPADADRKTRRG